jgi:hypothetical protein
MLKECNKCKINKPVLDFNIDRRSPTGKHMSICKPCRAEASKKWRLNQNEYERKRYAANPVYQLTKFVDFFVVTAIE